MEARWCTSSVGRDKVSTELFGGGLCALSTTEIRLSHEHLITIVDVSVFVGATLYLVSSPAHLRPPFLVEQERWSSA